MQAIKIKNMCFSIGGASRSAVGKAREKIEGFFDRLPLLQPWVWISLAAVAIAGFGIGAAVALWAYFSLL